jgi:hypothetical protein
MVAVVVRRLFVCAFYRRFSIHSVGSKLWSQQTCTTGTSGTALICYISSFYGLAMCVLPFKLFDRLKNFSESRDMSCDTTTTIDL